mmetsp:Transcript_55241/g.131689  ORF Transcript_55241/g.131689 Transcript_55241/m.131689 type:complete len:241 (-) Transcript_55241:332-1054(-)
MPTRRLGTLRLATKDAPWCIDVASCVAGHLVHVGVVNLQATTHEVLTLLLHGLIHTCRILKLHMREVSTHLVLRDPDLRDSTTILEEVNDVVLAGSVVCPANPDGAASVWLLLARHATIASSSSSATASAKARAAPTARAAAAAAGAATSSAASTSASASPLATAVAVAVPVPLATSASAAALAALLLTSLPWLLGWTGTLGRAGTFGWTGSLALGFRWARAFAFAFRAFCGAPALAHRL